MIELIQPLNLTAESRVLVVGAGLGGSTRAIARHTGAMVIGIEENNELADAAMERSIFLGMSDQARVRSLVSRSIASALSLTSSEVMRST